MKTGYLKQCYFKALALADCTPNILGIEASTSGRNYENVLAFLLATRLSKKRTEAYTPCELVQSSIKNRWVERWKFSSNEGTITLHFSTQLYYGNKTGCHWTLDLEEV